ncbi:MAG TPA: hypothetical protein VKA08_19755 [Balneolales bacterium]|nr:hypothetical protein [Balneolales bacterium]
MNHHQPNYWTEHHHARELFDKTGTLSYGEFRETSALNFDLKTDDQEILKLAASLEQSANISNQ